MPDPRCGVACETLEPRTLLTSVGAAYAVPARPALEVAIERDWKFIRQDVDGASVPSFNDANWSRISLPHTWNAADGTDGGDDYYRGVGWYRRRLSVPDSFAGKRVLLHFDAASLATDVWIDGNPVGSHVGGFSAFNFDVSNRLTPGEHLLAVKVSNAKSLLSSTPPQGGDYTVYGGIHRDVKLIATDPVHVRRDDLGAVGVRFTTPSVSDHSASIRVRSQIENDASVSRSVAVRTLLLDADGVVVAFDETTKAIGASSATAVEVNETVAEPRLWNGIADPYLHTLVVEVRDGATDDLLDLHQERVGIRRTQINSNGFYLNGRKYELRGVNLHQDRAGKGSAISDADVEQDVEMVLELGATMVRTAHYQHGRRFYELADERGLVVWTETPVNGTITFGSTPSGSSFLNASKQQLRELIRQNANRASIATWGLFNELADNSTSRWVITALQTLAHDEDSTRPTTAATWSSSVRSLDRIPDTIGFNRYYGWKLGSPSDWSGFLDQLRSANPTRAIAVSEYGGGANLRQRQEVAAPIDFQLDYLPQEVQMRIHEQTWPLLAERDWLWAKLAWQMFDGGADHRTDGIPGINNKGLVSFDRKTKKDSFFFYKAAWTDSPVLHLTAADWQNRNRGSATLKVYSNLDNVRVSVNGAAPGTLGKSGVVHTKSLTLKTGENSIVVTATRGGKTYSQRTTWRYWPTPTGTKLKTLSLSVAQPEASVSLPNGEYDVRITAGDGSTARVNNLWVEGRAMIDDDGLDGSDTFVTRVRVGDGQLTIKPGADGIGPVVSKVEVFATTPVVGARVSGTVFNDGNRNGKRDAGEAGLSGLIVWLDLDNDKRIDANERQTRTRGDGTYELLNLESVSGAARVRVLVPSGYQQILPANGYGYSINSSAGAVNGGKNFALAPLAT